MPIHLGGIGDANGTVQQRPAPAAPAPVPAPGAPGTPPPPTLPPPVRASSIPPGWAPLHPSDPTQFRTRVSRGRSRVWADPEDPSTSIPTATTPTAPATTAPATTTHDGPPTHGWPRGGSGSRRDG